MVTRFRLLNKIRLRKKLKVTDVSDLRLQELERDSRRLDYLLNLNPAINDQARGNFYLPETRGGIDAAIGRTHAAPEQWESVAYWPELVKLGNTDNASVDTHATREQAEAVCGRLHLHGFGGNKQIFPLRTEVRPAATDGGRV